MKKILLLSFISLFFLPLLAWAQTTGTNSGSQAIINMQNNAQAVNNEIGLNISAVSIVAAALQIILGLLGIIFLGIVVYSGIQWMTAGGNEDAIKKAKANIKNAVIGVVIVALSYTITYFIFNQNWSFLGATNTSVSSGM